MEREGHCKPIPLACVGSAWSGWTALDLPQPKAACTSWIHTAQAAGCSARAVSQVGPAFGAFPRSRLLRFRFLGTPQGYRLSWAFVLCPSQIRAAQAQVFGERGCCDLSPPPSLPLSLLGVQLAHLHRQMLTFQNPKKSWLAMKPACSLVDDASLGP